MTSRSCRSERSYMERRRRSQFYASDVSRAEAEAVSPEVSAAWVVGCSPATGIARPTVRPRALDSSCHEVSVSATRMILPFNSGSKQVTCFYNKTLCHFPPRHLAFQGSKMPCHFPRSVSHLINADCRMLGPVHLVEFPARDVLRRELTQWDRQMILTSVRMHGNDDAGEMMLRGQGSSSRYPPTTGYGSGYLDHDYTEGGGYRQPRFGYENRDAGEMLRGQGSSSRYPPTAGHGSGYSDHDYTRGGGYRQPRFGYENRDAGEMLRGQGSSSRYPPTASHGSGYLDHDYSQGGSYRRF